MRDKEECLMNERMANWYLDVSYVEIIDDLSIELTCACSLSQPWVLNYSAMFH